jgi:hypothetical protein
MADLGHPLSDDAAREMLGRVRAFVLAAKHPPSEAELLALLGVGK